MERLHQALEKESYPLDICIDGISSGKGRGRTDMPCAALEDEDNEFVGFVKNYNSTSRPTVIKLLLVHKILIIFRGSISCQKISLCGLCADLTGKLG